MKFMCPRCQTSYELPREALPVPGDDKVPQRLKCVRCKCVFVMTVEMVSQEQSLQNARNVYFELASPVPAPVSQMTDAANSDMTQRMRIELRPLDVRAEEIGPEVSSATAWKSSNTLVLSDYEIDSFRRSARRRIALASLFVSLFLGFVLYVAAMNDWAISVNQLDQNIKRAFFLQSEKEVEADLLQFTTVTLGKGYTLWAGKGRTMGIIQGEIQNNGKHDLRGVQLEGRILDASKNVVSTVIVPCGVRIADSRLRKIKTARIPQLYMAKGQMKDCEIRSGYSQKFKVVFPELPPNFNNTHVFEVHPYKAGLLNP